MIFFSPHPLQFARISATLAPPAMSTSHDAKPRLAPRSVLERSIEVWTAPYVTGGMPSY